jgi:hypothetical protein
VKTLQTAARIARKAVAAVHGAVARRPRLSQDALDERDYVATVNAEAAARRAERSKTWDQLVGGGRWLSRRPGWTKPRPRGW